MIEPVAEALGNTVAISRKSYVHPALIEAAKDAAARPAATAWSGRARASGCRRAEVGLLEFLARRQRPREAAADAA